MLRFFCCVSFTFAVLCIVAISTVSAQEAEDEMLFRAVTVSSETGMFKNINYYPESIRHTKPFARMVHELRHYTGPDGIDNRQIRLEAFEKSKEDIIRNDAASDKVSGSLLPAFSNPWTNVGPVNTAGCTKALAFDPTDGNIIYAGAAGGGVWKTINAGASWTPLTDLVIPDLAVASIAVDPSSPNTIYVGSGDPSVASDGLPGTGLYKSIDAGVTWTHIATSTLPGTVNKVLVHPTNSDIVFACRYDGTRGLFRSTDGGTTFKKVFPAAKFSDGVIWDVIPAQVSGSSLIMYLVEGNQPQEASSECGIYQSIDDGQTWTKLSSPGFPAGSRIGKAALAIPSSDKRRVYCLMANPDGDLRDAGLWKSVNSGGTFTPISTVPVGLFNPQGSGAQGWYDLYLGIAPGTTPNDTLYIGGVEAYYSFNSGSSWHGYSDYGVNRTVHVDHQSIALDPVNSRNVFIGTDGGIYRSTDAGQTWSYRSKGFQTVRFYHIALDANDQLKSYGGSQDQGTWKVVAGQSPAFLFGGDGFQPIVDPGNANILYVEGPFGDLYKSSNGGINFNSINNPAFIQSSASYEPSDWETPFVMAPKNSSMLFTGRQRLWQTKDGGGSWAAISPTFVYNSRTLLVESIGISPANPNTFWVGLERGKIQMTSSAGASWADRSVGTPGSTVRSIVCSPTDPNWALAAFESYGASARILRTTNAGSSWQNVSGSGSRALPAVPVNCIALDSTSPAAVWYAATDNGMYYTRDSGNTWMIAGAGIGLAPCWDVQIHANKVTIKVGTHGRGIWEANVNIIPVEFDGLVASKTETGTKLDWKTTSEQNDSGFRVERSYNYQPFEDIFFQPAAGNSTSGNSYTYFDPKHDDGYYIYRLARVDLDGSTHLSNIVAVRYGASSSELSLSQSFPNPFFIGESKGGSARIRYALPAADDVTLRIYSLSGAPVKTLVDHIQQNAGDQEAFWDGTDNNGTLVASGTYYYSLETGSGGKLRNKMILIAK